MDQTAETSQDRDPRLRKNGKKRNRRCSLQFNNQGRRFLCILTRGGTCLRKWQGCMDQRIRKTNTHPYFFAVLDPYLWIFDEHFSTIITIFDDFWYLHVSHSFSQWWLLIVLTILNNSVTIFDDFSIKSFVQVEEYTHFYRFSCTVGTYTSAPYRE